MGKTTKGDLAKYALFVSLFAPGWLSAVFTTVLLLLICLTWLSLSHWAIHKALLTLIAPILGLILIGTLGAVHYPLYDVFKDVWYVGKIIIAMASGYLLTRDIGDIRIILRTVIYAGVASAVVHSILLLIYFRSGASLLDIRNEENVKGYVISLIALAIMVTVPRDFYGMRKHKLQVYIALLLCFISLVASVSRTYFIVFTVIFVFLKGWHRLTAKNITFALCATILTVFFIFISNQSSTDGKLSFSQKFQHSATEVAIQNYDDMRDINLNWRGFESYRAVVDFESGTYIQQLIGQGLGATVDLGFEMLLGGGYFRYIPTLHNGYMYVLVKFGILGLLIYLYFLFRLILIRRLLGNVIFSAQQLILSRLLIGLSWSLFLTTFVIAGPFNKSTMISTLVLIGVILGFLQQHHTPPSLFKELSK